MPLFGACPHCEDYRAQRDRAQQELSAVLADQAALLKDVLAVKRHDLGLPPAGFEVKDPTSELGPRTLAAIEEQGGGLADMRGYLTNWAVVQTKAALAQGEDKESADTMVAHAIRIGEAR